MPYIIKSINEIQQLKQRPVLFIRFPELRAQLFDDSDCFPDFKNYSPRTEFLSFLVNNNIEYELATEISYPDCFESYCGQLYIDIPYDITNTKYIVLADYLETDSGALKDPRVQFLVYDPCLLK